MIETQTATVYKSTSAGRRYFTKRAAIRAEARAILDAWYPYDPPSDYNEYGNPAYPGEPGWRGVDNSYELFDWVVDQIKSGRKPEDIDMDSF